MSSRSVFDVPPATAREAVQRLLLPLFLPVLCDAIAMGIIIPVLPLFLLSVRGICRTRQRQAMEFAGQ
jgi:hypothetical protein